MHIRGLLQIGADSLNYLKKFAKYNLITKRYHIAKKIVMYKIEVYIKVLTLLLANKLLPALGNI